MRRRATWVLLALFAVTATVAIYTTWLQYRAYDDDRTFDQRHDLSFGVYVDGPTAPIPDLNLDFARTDGSTVLVSMTVGVSSEVGGPPGTDLTCYLVVPPGTEPATDAEVAADDTINYSSSVAAYGKWDDHWVYAMSCELPDPPADEKSSTSSSTRAVFRVGENNLYRTKYDQYELEFEINGVIGVESNDTDKPKEAAFFKKFGATTYSYLSYSVDGDGWDIEAHLPPGAPVARETSSAIEVRQTIYDPYSNTIGRTEGETSGTATVTMTRSSGQARLAIIQLASALILGVVADRLATSVFASRTTEAASARPTPASSATRKRGRDKARRNAKRKR
jgi:hypothetical protein